MRVHFSSSVRVRAIIQGCCGNVSQHHIMHISLITIIERAHCGSFHLGIQQRAKRLDALWLERINILIPRSHRWKRRCWASWLCNHSRIHTHINKCTSAAVECSCNCEWCVHHASNSGMLLILARAALPAFEKSKSISFALGIFLAAVAHH